MPLRSDVPRHRAHHEIQMLALAGGLRFAWMACGNNIDPSHLQPFCPQSEMGTAGLLLPPDRWTARLPAPLAQQGPQKSQSLARVVSSLLGQERQPPPRQGPEVPLFPKPGGRSQLEHQLQHWLSDLQVPLPP